MPRFAILLICGLFLAPPALAGTPDTLALEANNAGNICRRAIAVAETRNKIPGELLQAVGVIESGKWNEREKSLNAWPWTVTVEGTGHYYKNFDTAYKAIRKFQKKGITNIDVGCMQINLGYHGKNFLDVKEVLDPVNNVAYGASFLTHLRAREKSWTRAVKFYHSANRMYHNPYVKKVIKRWRELRKVKIQASGKMGGKTGGKNSVQSKQIAQNSDTKTEIKPKSDAAQKISKIAHWPPKNYKSQKQLEALARARFGVARN